MTKSFVVAALLAACTMASQALAATAPLDANSSYTINVAKMNSNGTVSEVSTTAATTDANRKLDFTLGSVPTKDEVNFIVLTLKDASNNVVRKAVLPAPPADGNNKIGMGDLASRQADILLAATAAAGSDDPILVAYLLTIIRSPKIADSDVPKLAALGRAAIIGSGSDTFEGFLLNKGIQQQQLTDLKKCLVYNSDPTKATLRSFGKGLYQASRGVDENGGAIVEGEELQRTGGIMADIFIDAAACAGIDLSLVSLAHEAAGDGASGSGALEAMGTNTNTSIDQSMSAFGQKMAMTRVAASYSNALKTLGASESQITRFLAAVQAMATANRAIDTAYAGFYADPGLYASEHNTTIEAISQAMQTAYSGNWNIFRQAIAATSEEIQLLKAIVAAANGGITLPAGFGTFRDMTGETVNWPLPQVIMVARLNLFTTFTYGPRDITEIPVMARQWLGVCSSNGQQIWNQNSCETAGGVWTVQRTVFSGPSATLNAYHALEQDLNIVEMSRNDIWQNGGQPNQAQRRAAEELFMARIESIKSHIGGTDGGSPLTAGQKDAIVRLMMQPSI